MVVFFIGRSDTSVQQHEVV